MSTVVMVAVAGLIMAFFAIIVAALVGYATIRKQPLVLLRVAPEQRFLALLFLRSLASVRHLYHNAQDSSLELVHPLPHANLCNPKSSVQRTLPTWKEEDKSCRQGAQYG